jgi:tetratricopeptide (TPR) repeat protein
VKASEKDTNMTLFNENLVEQIKALDEVSLMAYRTGDYADAVRPLREALKLRREVLAATHRDVLLNLANLGAALGRLGYLEEAQTAFEECLETWKLKDKESNPDGGESMNTLTTKMHLGVCLKQLGKFERSELLLHSALDGSVRLTSAEKEDASRSLACVEAAYAYAVLSFLQGRRAKAHYLFAIATKGLTSLLGASHRHAADARVWVDRTRELVPTTDVAVEPMAEPLQQALERLDSVPSLETMNRWDTTTLNAKRLWKSSLKCQLCAQAFTLTQREHHCRVCTKAVCHGCSPGQVYVGMVRGKARKERVCNLCALAGF